MPAWCARSLAQPEENDRQCQKSCRKFPHVHAATPLATGGTAFLPWRSAVPHIPVPVCPCRVPAGSCDQSFHWGLAESFSTAHTRLGPYTPATCRAGAPATHSSATPLARSHCCSPRSPARAPHRPPAASRPPHPRAPAPPPRALQGVPPAGLRSLPTRSGILGSSLDDPSAPKTLRCRFLNTFLNPPSGTSAHRPSSCMDSAKTFPPSG